MSEIEPEYSTVFDTWSIQFVSALAKGLASEQSRGSMRVRSIEMNDELNVVRVVVEHYGNQDHPNSRCGYELMLNELKRMAPEGDPVNSSGFYLDDIASPGAPKENLEDDEVTWTVRPGWMNSPRD